MILVYYLTSTYLPTNLPIYSRIEHPAESTVVPSSGFQTSQLIMCTYYCAVAGKDTFSAILAEETPARSEQSSSIDKNQEKSADLPTDLIRR